MLRLKKLCVWSLIIFLSLSCQRETKEIITQKERTFLWENANVYFLLTDRFNNGDPSNDVNFDRTEESSVLRGFEGGDFKGITEKINEGYFNDLGVNAMWFSPVFEQNRGIVDEGTGPTYAYHGYWIQDWSSIDPNYGTEDDLRELIKAAHDQGIRVIMDIVINHTGPVTDQDPLWSDWARTEPQCKYQDFESTVSCTLVENLPDVYTESDAAVELPEFLVAKWKAEGRYEKEIEELDTFFEKTKLPRAPRFYIMKWLLDLIKDYGVDGFRVDTAKHTEETVWQELNKIAQETFTNWKQDHPDEKIDDSEFFMVAEVYGYNISGNLEYDYSDRKVDFFKDAFQCMINFEFKADATQDYEFIFNKYSNKIQNELKGNTVMNYLSSHDDGSPFDRNRSKSIEAGTKLLLAPGVVQLYYGDETARMLNVEANGDASLRGNMNWGSLDSTRVRTVLDHYQKLGNFRADHLAIGAGIHQMISETPYYFKRTYNKGNIQDEVIIGLGLGMGNKTVSVQDIFTEGDEIRDAYSGMTSTVEGQKVSFDTEYEILLLEKKD